MRSSRLTPDGTGEESAPDGPELVAMAIATMRTAMIPQPMSACCVVVITSPACSFLDEASCYVSDDAASGLGRLGIRRLNFSNAFWKVALVKGTRDLISLRLLGWRL